MYLIPRNWIVKNEMEFAVDMCSLSIIEKSGPGTMIKQYSSLVYVKRFLNSIKKCIGYVSNIILMWTFGTLQKGFAVLINVNN